MINNLYLQIKSALYEELMRKSLSLDMTIEEYCTLILESEALKLEKQEIERELMEGKTE